jgi:hypothetical protein
MKKLLLILSVCTVIGASSCSKSYKCNCYNTQNMGYIYRTVNSTSKWTAEVKCSTMSDDSLTCMLDQ